MPVSADVNNGPNHTLHTLTLLARLSDGETRLLDLLAFGKGFMI